jgi:hypothetical protein
MKTMKRKQEHSVVDRQEKQTPGEFEKACIAVYEVQKVYATTGAAYHAALKHFALLLGIQVERREE